jgi:hypothetical protein
MSLYSDVTLVLLKTVHAKVTEVCGPCSYIKMCFLTLREGPTLGLSDGDQTRHCNSWRHERYSRILVRKPGGKKQAQDYMG